jgi:hypothetical protein
MVAGVEVDPLVLSESPVAERRQPEKLAERGDRAGLKPRQFEDFLAAQEAELAPVPLAANPAAVEPAIGGYDEHYDPAVALADKRFGAARERRAPNTRGLLARVDRFVTQDIVPDAVPVKEVFQSVKDALGHRLFSCLLLGRARRRVPKPELGNEVDSEN